MPYALPTDLGIYLSAHDALMLQRYSDRYAWARQACIRPAWLAGPTAMAPLMPRGAARGRGTCTLRGAPVRLRVPCMWPLASSCMRGAKGMVCARVRGPNQRSIHPYARPPRFEELQYADEASYMAGGKVTFTGKPDQLKLYMRKLGAPI